MNKKPMELSQYDRIKDTDYKDLMTVDKQLIKETISTLKHAKVFISTKEKMHPTGQKLYQDNIEKLEKFIGEK